MTCPARTLDGERCTVGKDPCRIHGPWSAAPSPAEPEPIRRSFEEQEAYDHLGYDHDHAACEPDDRDPRLVRLHDIGQAMRSVPELSAERRALLLELRAEGWTVTALAAELGMARSYVSGLLSPNTTTNRKASQ